MMAYYVVYVIAVIISRYLYQKKKQKWLRQFRIDQGRLLAEESGENALIEEAGRQIIHDDDRDYDGMRCTGCLLGSQNPLQDDTYPSQETSAENQYGPWFFKYKTFATKAHGPRRKSEGSSSTSRLFSSIASLAPGSFRTAASAPIQTSLSPWKNLENERIPNRSTAGVEGIHLMTMR